MLFFQLIRRAFPLMNNQKHALDMLKLQHKLNTTKVNTPMITDQQVKACKH